MTYRPDESEHRHNQRVRCVRQRRAEATLSDFDDDIERVSDVNNAISGTYHGKADRANPPHPRLYQTRPHLPRATRSRSSSPHVTNNSTEAPTISRRSAGIDGRRLGQCADSDWYETGWGNDVGSHRRGVVFVGRLPETIRRTRCAKARRANAVLDGADAVSGRAPRLDRRVRRHLLALLWPHEQPASARRRGAQAARRPAQGAER
ncbi:MAG: hypothetical protein QOI29_1937 [Mycobacterium sp.]|nr:hypothetical protein [Mycobacterium sp.]